jgi:hypothetical protein
VKTKALHGRRRVLKRQLQAKLHGARPVGVKRMKETVSGVAIRAPAAGG